ncbi:MAG: hypothetical protein NVS4B6_28910 [Mycobacterium sp.]
MRKLFATSSLVVMVIVGAATLANAAPDPSESGPTSAINAPHPVHSGYGY